MGGKLYPVSGESKNELTDVSLEDPEPLDVLPTEPFNARFDSS
jgi:hypothetical protein